MTKTKSAERVVLFIACPEIRAHNIDGYFVPRYCAALDEALAHGLTRDVRIAVVHKAALEEDGAVQGIRTLRKRAPLTDVLVWAPKGTGALVRAGLKGGAHDVILDASQQALVASVIATLETQRFLPRVLKVRQARKRTTKFEGMVSRSSAMWDIFEQAAQVSPTDATVLILGATGTGKDLLARAIHRLSGRRGRFVPLNCGAVTETLIDSELFGHTAGSFTGAKAAKTGMFKQADHGTLFLDEIGNLPRSAQYRLLRTLQDGMVRPVGAQEEIPVDVRVIAATNTPLHEAVTVGQFREDLFFRLDVIRFVIPPLRERQEDIVLLFGHFLKIFVDANRLPKVRVTDDLLDELVRYSWPGNVREIENVTQRLVLLHPDERVTAAQFRELMQRYQPQQANGGEAPSGLGQCGTGRGGQPRIDLNRTLEENLRSSTEQRERAYLKASLRENRGRIAATAEQAGISRRTLLRKLIKYGIDKRRLAPR